MEAKERTVSNILTEQICYEIPPYQRPYSWGQENVQQLLDDMWESYEEKDAEYFIGSLITIEKERDRRYDVVDGQQRLTTLNVILARLRDHIQDEAVKADLDKRILPRNVYTGEAETPRLLLRNSDRAFFRKHILEGEAVTEKLRSDLEAKSPARHLVENAETVDAFCDGKSQSVLKLFTNFVLTRVNVVFVTTQSWQSAYRLFNVLNARGMPLSNSDLIKNSLFGMLGAASNRSGELEERWQELEEELGIERMDSFFGHHRTSIVAAKARSTLHEEFEPLLAAEKGGAFAFLEKINASAENYMKILEVAFTDPETIRSLRALRRVGYDEWIPAFLAFLNAPPAGMSEVEFTILLEKVTMQNWVRRMGRAARLTVYYQLINAIRDGRPAAEIVEIFRKNAKNDEFLNLLGSDVYGQPFAAAVLLRLEEAAQDLSVTKSYAGRVTIEHVLPQALKDPYWQTRFTQEQHSHWLHRLGNITLLSGNKNYKAQYFDFDRKKRIYNDRNRKVSFDLTKEVCDQQEWTVSEVQQRHDRLLDLAKRTWVID